MFRGRETPPGQPLKGWVENLLGLFYPERCLFCKGFIERKEEAIREFLCFSCAAYYKPGGKICPHCGGFFRDHPPCACLEDNPDEMPLRALFTISLYDHRWREVIHDLKYRNRRSAARILGFWLAGEITGGGYCHPDLVVPIPLHRLKEKERGYNQSALLAVHAAKKLNIPCQYLLIKHKETASQTAISRLDRRENVREVFKSTGAIQPGMIILLVDDVYSTGSTMKEAAAVLHKEGAEVYGAVISYNPGTLTLKKTGFYEGLDRW